LRDTLIAALTSCAASSFKPKARRFLSGLSCDELQFIAEYVGSRILESSFGTPLADDPPQRLSTCQPQLREDLEHKMVLVTEFFGVSQRRLARASQA
jgi:hypothetical protein